MENGDRALVVIMIVIVIIVGVILLVPKRYAVGPVRTGLSAAVYNSSYVPAANVYVQDPYYRAPWYYNNGSNRTTSSVTTYSTSQPQVYTYTTTTPTYYSSSKEVMCGFGITCAQYWAQNPQYNSPQYQNQYPYGYNY